MTNLTFSNHTPTLPIPFTLDPEQLTLLLDGVRAQLERAATDQGLLTAFDADGDLTPDLEATPLGQTFTRIQSQADLADRVREQLPRLAATGAITLLVGGTGLALRQAHRRGWTDRLKSGATRVGRVVAALNPLRLVRHSEPLANPAARFVRDLAGTGQPVHLQPVLEGGTPFTGDPWSGPLLFRRDAHFLLASPDEPVIFPPEAVVNVVLTVVADGSTEATVLINNWWQPEVIA